MFHCVFVIPLLNDLDFLGYVRSKFGDQSGRTNSDEEEESEDEETSKEETESSSEETESSVSDRQQRHPPPRPDLYYPDRDRDNQSETTSVPAIAVNSPVGVSLRLYTL